MKTKNLCLMFLMALMLVGFNSCKKETVDVTDLLKTVPSSAGGVVVINMEGIIKDAGCKIKNHVIEPGADVQALLDKSSEGDKNDFMMLLNGETGIEPKGAVVFYDSNRAFLTFALYDVKKFTDYIENKKGEPFTEESSGVKVCKDIAVKGAQAWICLTSGSSIDTAAIAAYSQLGTSQSFLVTPIGEQLLVSEDDVRGWAMINIFLNNIWSNSKRTQLNLGLGILFEDAESVKFSMDFKQGELETEAIILNDEYKPAKYQLPAEKIDVNTLKSLGETCQGMMAFTINQKLIKKFDKLGSAFGGFIDLGEMFKNIDGTVGIVASGNDVSQSLNGVITTKGDASKDLRDMVSMILGPVSQDGKFLRFSKGDVKGSLKVAECAEELKGCCFGVVVSMDALNDAGYGRESQGFKESVVKLKPESGGLELELEMHTTNPKENSLLTILRNM